MKLARAYIRVVDAVNYRVGRIMMYGIFVMIGILLWSSISKTFFLPSLWTLEIAQFALVAYYIMGGPYSMQLGSNVRMDLFYGQWSARKKAKFDAFTILFLIFYLGVLLYGGLESTAYSLGHFGDEPFQYLTGLITGSEKRGPAGAQPDRVAALSLADQDPDVHRNLPDAAAGGLRTAQGHHQAARG